MNGLQTTSLTLLGQMGRPDESDAWGRFVRLYSKGIYSWVRGQGFQHEDAADIVQDVFLTLLQKLSQYRPQGPRSFRHWLWVVTRNKCRERARRRPMPLVPDELLGAVTEDDREPLWEVDFRRHLISQIASVIEYEYEPQVWRAFWKHAVEGESAASVAVDLGISQWAVYAAKGRIVRRLNEEFADLVAD